MDSPIIFLIGGGAIAVVLVIIGVVISATDESKLVDKRLERYTGKEEAARMAKGERVAPLTDWLNTQGEKFSWGENMARELARADLKLKVGELLALILISAAVVALVAFFVSDQSKIAALVGAVIGMFLPRFYVKQQQGRRLVRFNDQLGDMLNLMVNGLRAGYSTMQAMEAVAKELPPPICDEFRRVVQEMQLGVAMEKALDNLLRRIPSTDLDLVITAMNVQREVGGNLAEILDTISHTIRERVRVKGEIRVLTAQVMISGRLLAALPILVLGAIYLLNKTYFGKFVAPETRLIGIPILIYAGLLIIAGYFSMTRLAKIDI